MRRSVRPFLCFLATKIPDEEPFVRTHTAILGARLGGAPKISLNRYPVICPLLQVMTLSLEIHGQRHDKEERGLE
jgi:hypothetical protein